MKAYTSLIKILAIVLLIPIALGAIVLLGYIGFAIDFSNAWTTRASGGSNSMYMVILPIGFIAIIGWAIYVLSRRRTVRKTEKQETEIRQQIYREQSLGANNHDVVVNTLARYGSKSVIELSKLTGINHDEILEATRELLQSGRIQQDVKQNPPRFYVTNKD